MALTYAHSDERPFFEWHDIVEAMTTVETGTAVGIEYIAEETRAVAIHEAGHAVDEPRVHGAHRVHASLDPHARPARSATTRRSRRRSASPPGATRRWRS